MSSASIQAFKRISNRDAIFSGTGSNPSPTVGNPGAIVFAAALEGAGQMSGGINGATIISVTVDTTVVTAGLQDVNSGTQEISEAEGSSPKTYKASNIHNNIWRFTIVPLL